jgi:hypothetical protein
MADLTMEAVAGLILYRDRDSKLHVAAESGLPESFSISGNSLVLMRVRHDPSAYVKGNHIVIRTVEESAVYAMTAPSDDGDIAACRIA